MPGLDDYEIGEKIAEGGVATVFKGVQRSLRRPVAIKLLSRQLNNLDVVVRHFDQESLIVARLAHPNIIHVIDRGIAGGLPYFVMEYVDGRTLAEVMKEPLDVSAKLDIIVQICKALSYAHRNDILHCDIKPGNILINRDGNVVVTDFGIASLLKNGATDKKGSDSVWIMGTPGYMAPEQLVGSLILTPACDIYSLGIIMQEFLVKHARVGDVIPSPLAAIIQKCIAENPEERFALADEVMRELLGLLRGAHIREDLKSEIYQTTATDIRKKYSLLDIIKQDRFGSTYLFENNATRKLLVLKKVLNSATGQTEAKTLSHLSHVNIAPILGISVKPRMFVIAMEYQSGGSLMDRLVKPFPWKEAIKIVRDVAGGLAFAHCNRVVHGNLRPSNILFADDNTPKIADFGIKEHYATDDGKENWYSLPAEPISRRTDIFALGVILHEMLTGDRPVWKSGQLVTRRALTWSLPGMLSDILAKMLWHEPAKRYDSMEAVIADLDDITADGGSARNGKTGFRWNKLFAAPRWVTALLVILALTVTTSLLTWHYSDKFMPVIQNLLGQTGTE
jgi:serine/threonine-protein kinase